MPDYRLIADHGSPGEVFEAPGDDIAEQHARKQASKLATAKPAGHRLEREVDGAWKIVVAWMPRRVHDYPGGWS